MVLGTSYTILLAGYGEILIPLGGSYTLFDQFIVGDCRFQAEKGIKKRGGLEDTLSTISLDDSSLHYPVVVVYYHFTVIFNGSCVVFLNYIGGVYKQDLLYIE